MRIHFFLLFFLCTSSAVFGQGVMSNHNLIYVEVLGNSHLVTLNYERLSKQKSKQKLGAIVKSYRVGLGVSSNDLSLPLSINLMKPIRSKAGHYLLLSGGPTIYTQDFKDFSLDQSIDESDTYVILNLGFGYRFTKPDGKFFFQGTINPHIDLDVTASSGTTNTGLDWSFGLAAGIRL